MAGASFIDYDPAYHGIRKGKGGVAGAELTPKAVPIAAVKERVKRVS